MWVDGRVETEALIMVLWAVLRAGVLIMVLNGKSRYKLAELNARRNGPVMCQRRTSGTTSGCLIMERGMK